MFLKNTIEDILKNIRGNTEVIAILDGQWADPPIQDDPRVTLVYYSQSIGQRAACNVAVNISTAKYIMKVDAHCAFDEGFDIKMMADMQDDWTMIPVMRNLHVFDWVCPEGHRRYQSPSGVCRECGKETVRDIVWIAKTNPQSIGYRFDNTMHFQYWNELKNRQTGDLTETMSIQGSCFMVTRDKYLELNLCDEAHGSWGQQGVEVALKTWLSGGKVIVNRKTWYAHMFRTQGEDFGFPYPQSGNQVEKAREYSRDLWINDKWDRAIHPLSWLIGRFAPVPDWDKSWGVVYYTDNELNPEIMEKCQKQLRRCVGEHRLVSVSLKPIEFGDNIVLPLERGYLTMFKQILAGLEGLKTDYVFFAEHDILYHPSHFQFIPAESEKFYYNINVWKVRMSDGYGLHYDCQQLSGLCANRELLLKHYHKRVEIIEATGYTRSMGFEPGTHNRKERVDDYKAESWKSEYPNIDLRHENNLTKSRWTKAEFRNQKYTEGWIENDKVPGWGHMWHWWKRI
jgi:glycosyltransferase involved in cell wall biosynthesis